MSYFGSYPKEDNHKPTPKVNEAPQRQARKLVAPPGGQSKFSLAWDEPEPQQKHVQYSAEESRPVFQQGALPQQVQEQRQYQYKKADNDIFNTKVQAQPQNLQQVQQREDVNPYEGKSLEQLEWELAQLKMQNQDYPQQYAQQNEYPMVDYTEQYQYQPQYQEQYAQEPQYNHYQEQSQDYRPQSQDNQYQQNKKQNGQSNVFGGNQQQQQAPPHKSTNKNYSDIFNEQEQGPALKGKKQMNRNDNTKNNIFGNDYVEANDIPSKISNKSQRIQDKNQALIQQSELQNQIFLQNRANKNNSQKSNVFGNLEPQQQVQRQQQGKPISQVHFNDGNDTGPNLTTNQINNLKREQSNLSNNQVPKTGNNAYNNRHSHFQLG